MPRPFILPSLILPAAFFLNAARAQTAPTPAEKSTLTVTTETHPIARNPLAPISDTNPEDPNRSYTLTNFQIPDGTLEFKQYPKRDAGTGAEITFRHAPKDDTETYAFFPPMMRLIQEEKPSPNRALSIASIAYLYEHQNTRFFARLDLAPEDLKFVTAEFQNLKVDLLTLDANVAAGSLDPKQYTPILAALQSFRDLAPLDLKDPKQIAAAQKILDLGIPYAKHLQDLKLARIKKFSDLIAPELSDAQKESAVKVADELLQSYRIAQHARAHPITIPSPATAPIIRQ